MELIMGNLKTGTGTVLKAFYRILIILLAASFLALVVGAAWHHHHHDDHADESCIWCLALASVVVLAIVSGIPAHAQRPLFLVAPFLPPFVSGLHLDAVASRAPPAPWIDTI